MKFKSPKRFGHRPDSFLLAQFLGFLALVCWFGPLCDAGRAASATGTVTCTCGCDGDCSGTTGCGCPPTATQLQAAGFKPSGQNVFNVVNDNAEAYIINGGYNPDITLVRGTTYTFNVNANGHPFAIKTIEGPGRSDLFSEGVTNNEAQVGVVTFTVPQDAPHNLYYDCEIHTSMAGNIFVVDSSAGNGAILEATQTVTGDFSPGGLVTFNIVITNTGTKAQTDNNGDEFFEAVPTQLTLQDVDSSDGGAFGNSPTDANGGSVSWNGGLDPGDSVTVTFTATVNGGTAGQTLTLQGFVDYDSDGDGTNDTTNSTDDPDTAAPNDPNIVNLPAVQLSATQIATGDFIPGGTVVYVVTLTNSGGLDQEDNSGHEFTESFPESVTVVSASASSGTAVADLGNNSVSWDGVVAANHSVTINITGKISAGIFSGSIISTQGAISYDYYDAGTNTNSGVTNDPSGGQAGSETNIIVHTPDDQVYVSGTQGAVFEALSNDDSGSVDLSVTGVTQGQFGSVTFTPDGILTYTPSGKLPAGGDTFTYTVSDGQGGTYTATVAVRDFSEAAATYNGLIVSGDSANPDNSSVGLLRVSLTPTGSFTGSLTIGGFKFAVSGVLDVYGEARFGKSYTASTALLRKTSAKAAPLAELDLGFQVAPTADLAQVTGTITEFGVPFARISADRAVYTAKKNPAPPLLSVPPAILGNYTVLFAPEAAPNKTLSAAQYPQGSGFALLSVATSGVAKLSGKLADGTPISYSNSLSGANTWPFYVSLYRGQGSVSGLVSFRDNNATNSDIDGVGLNWFRPAAQGATFYPNGWPNGILVDLFGSIFTVTKGASLIPGLDNAGDIDIVLNHGDLNGSTPFTATLSSKNKVTFVTAPPNTRPKLTISSNGLFSGSFLDPVSNKTTPIQGAVFQKQSSAAGYFLSPAQSGSVEVTP